jgi:hypothetical protein
MFGEIAAAASLGSSVLGGLGGSKGKGPTEISGFASLPGDQKDFMKEDVWSLIKDIFSRPYQGIPKRRINAEDTDPIFGSRARQDIQAYRDAQAAGAGTQTAAAPAGGASADEARGRQLAGLWGQPSGYGTQVNGGLSNLMANATAADFARLGQAVGNRDLRGFATSDGRIRDQKVMEILSSISKGAR